MNKHLMILVWIQALLATSSHATLVLSDTFSDGDRTNNPAWFISNGGFNVSFGEANNNNTSANQFFTTAFGAVSLNDQEGFRLTLSYRPEGTLLNTVRVGLFSGDAPTADVWSQFAAGQPTRDWRGYYATVGVDGSTATQLVRNDDALDDHAFFAGTVIGGNGTPVNTAGSATFRVLRFEMYRNGTDMVMEVFEGPDASNLVSLNQQTDSSGVFTGFNNVSFFHTTSSGNGHIRYDNITLELFVVPEPSAKLLLIGGFALASAWRRLPRR
jgi:hypothetical protein